jgi:hypothetical protein
MTSKRQASIYLMDRSWRAVPGRVKEAVARGERPESLPDLHDGPNALVAALAHAAALVKEAGPYGATGARSLPGIPVDAFNHVVWSDAIAPPSPFGRQDPYGAGSDPIRTPPQVAATVTGLLEATAGAAGRRSVSPLEVAAVALQSGAQGWAGALVLGKVLGAMAGVSEKTQANLRSAGLWGGLLSGAVSSAFGGRQ